MWTGLLRCARNDKRKANTKETIMKRHNHLWKEFISPENLELAANNAVKSKRGKTQTRHFLKHRSEYMQKLQDDLEHNRFRTSPYKIFTIFEPKKRQIYELPLYPDHIVHHALINVLGPIWIRMFIRDSFACIPGRGLHSASQRTMHFMRKHKYVLQCDIRKFYPSLDHNVMIGILKHKISDRRILDLLIGIIRSGGDGKNIPIGNLTSQWLGNVYLNELDYFIKQKLHWKSYLRYCDDFCLFGDDKLELHRIRQTIEHYLLTELKLTFSRCALRPTRCGINFIGYRFFPHFILMRQRSTKRLSRRIMNIARNDDVSMHSMGQLAAAHGWLKWACSYNFRRHLWARICQTKTTPYVRKFIRKHLFKR